jgi:hypothetical protein
MFALQPTSLVQIWSGNYATANAQIDELVSLADEKGAVAARESAAGHGGQRESGGGAEYNLGRTSRDGPSLLSFPDIAHRAGWSSRK